MSHLREEFRDILGNWSNICDLNDIPRRLKKIKKFVKENGELTEGEQAVVTFMKDVQVTREFVTKLPEEPNDESADE